MKTYKIYTARLVYGQTNHYKGTIQAENLDVCKEKIKLPEHQGGFFVNPVYAVIVDVTDGKNTIVYNEFLPFFAE